MIIEYEANAEKEKENLIGNKQIRKCNYKIS